MVCIDGKHSGLRAVMLQQLFGEPRWVVNLVYTCILLSAPPSQTAKHAQHGDGTLR